LFGAATITVASNSVTFSRARRSLQNPCSLQQLCALTISARQTPCGQRPPRSSSPRYVHLSRSSTPAVACRRPLASSHPCSHLSHPRSSSCVSEAHLRRRAVEAGRPLDHALPDPPRSAVDVAIAHVPARIRPYISSSRAQSSAPAAASAPPHQVLVCPLPRAPPSQCASRPPAPPSSARSTRSRPPRLPPGGGRRPRRATGTPSFATARTRT
jgi:hypothetical protein